VVELNQSALRWHTVIAEHSARIGAAQDLLVAGAAIVGIMNAGGWTSTTMTGSRPAVLESRSAN
jgi:hypothetical protein